MSEELTFMNDLAIWGAVVSTALGLIKLKEFLETRHNIYISESFTSSPDIGHEILVYNPSSRPINIIYLQIILLSKSGKREWKEVRTISHPDAEGFLNLSISPYSHKSLTFREEEYFPVSNYKVEFKFHIAGRDKPIVRTVYNP